MSKKKYIDANALKEIIDNPREMDYEYGRVSSEEVLMKIDSMPSADVEEIRHGEWIPITQIKHWSDTGITSTEVIGFHCSLCGAEEAFKYWYCHCGAKMDGGSEE